VLRWLTGLAGRTGWLLGWAGEAIRQTRSIQFFSVVHNDVNYAFGAFGSLAGWAGWLAVWLAACLAGLEVLLDKPYQFSSIQLFKMTAVTHLMHLAV